jgi:hypothetical protein
MPEQDDPLHEKARFGGLFHGCLSSTGFFSIHSGKECSRVMNFPVTLCENRVLTVY